MIRKLLSVLLILLSTAMITSLKPATATQTSYDINTLAGKLASVNNTPGLLISLSGFLQQEADISDQNANPTSNDPITPVHVLNSTLDGTTVNSPDVTVNQDTSAATQNEPTVAVDPNNANRIVAGSNVYFTGLGFDRTQAPNTVTLSKGTFDTSGNLHWGLPTFIGQTKAASTLNDKPWSTVDNNPASSFYGRIYVSWTRFIFNPSNGAYKQSPIIFAYSTDGGQTFSTPQLIAGNVLYSQGSHVMVGPDGTVYVLWDGDTRLGPFDSTWMTKSTDGGVTWTPPTAIAPLVDIRPPANTVFRVNSFPAGAVAPNGDVYAAWSTEALNTASTYGVDTTCFSSNTVCHAALYWSKSTNAGATWSTPQLAFPALDASSRTAIGYPQAQPSGGTLKAPAAQRIDTFFPAVAIAPNGNVYVSSYAADVVSPWQTCAQPASPTAVGRINCLALGNYINNARLDYVVTDLTTAKTQTVTTHPINSRYQFGGGFIGDYTDLAVDSNNNFHAIWADTNNQQTVVCWYGFQFTPTPVHQQDVVTNTGSF